MPSIARSQFELSVSIGWSFMPNDQAGLLPPKISRESELGYTDLKTIKAAMEDLVPSKRANRPGSFFAGEAA